MSCYRPVLGEYYFEDGIKKIRFAGGAYSPGFLASHPHGTCPIPCGNCIGCRLDNSRRWADRMMIELDHSKSALFLFLSYDDAHIPCIFDDETCELYYSLRKKDIQLFFKRLRYYFPEKHIRYYLCGEYGPQTLRPHYHAIVFGLSFLDFPDACSVRKNELGQITYSSEFLSRIWSDDDNIPLGFINFSNVTYKTCAYCARYVKKKASDDLFAYIEKTGVEPPFALMSRRPGIGGFYLQDHPEFDFVSKIYINDAFSSKPVSSVRCPDYLFDRLKDINEDAWLSIKAERRSLASDRTLIELQKTDLDFNEYLAVKEAKHLDAVKNLKRG